MLQLRFSLALIMALFPLTVQAATTIPLTVTMSENVVVTGTPQIAVDVGGVTRYATYTSGSSTNALTFTLSPQAGDLDLDGITLTSPLQLNGGTITDLAGNNAALTFTLPNTSGILVNYPSVGMNFTYDADGRYTLNGTAYNDLTSFLAAAGGTYARASSATYFDSTGTLQTAASGVPRFDHDPTTHVAKGILIEEQRTNYVTNANATGGTVGTIGSGGAMPTGWSRSTCTGISHELIGTGTINGLPYADIRVFGTNGNATTCFSHVYTQWTTVPVVPGEKWVLSAYTQLLSGTHNAGTMGTLNLGFQEFSAANSYLTGTTGGGTITSTLTKRYSPVTVINASTTQARMMINFAVTVGTTLDITFRVAAPQMEKGLFPSSFIPTSTGAVTRQADTLTLPTGSWYNSAAGAMMAVGDIPYVGGAGWPGLVAVDDGSGNNAMQLFINDAGTDSKSFEIFESGTNQTSYGGSAYSAGTTMKLAMGYASNNARASMDGTFSFLDTTVNVPTVSILRIGNGRSGNKHLNGHIQKMNYYPLRPTDTQLQKLTQ